MRRLTQLPISWQLVVLVIGDIAVAIIAYELAWHIPTLSSFGIFWKLVYPKAPLPGESLVNAPHNYWAVVLSQIVLFSLAGLYRVKNFTPKRTLLRIPPVLLIQMIFLSFLYLLTFARRNLLFSVFPVFWISNSIFTSLWRILTFYLGPLFTPKTPKFKPFYELMNFFQKDLARIFILGFMILLILSAVILIFDPEKIIVIGKRTFFVKWTAEQVANVAYFLLVIGVGIKFVSMARHKHE